MKLWCLFTSRSLYNNKSIENKSTAGLRKKLNANTFIFLFSANPTKIKIAGSSDFCAEWHVSLPKRIVPQKNDINPKIHSGFSSIHNAFLCTSIVLLFVAQSCSIVFEIFMCGRELPKNEFDCLRKLMHSPFYKIVLHNILTLFFLRIWAETGKPTRCNVFGGGTVGVSAFSADIHGPDTNMPTLVVKSPLCN